MFPFKILEEKYRSIPDNVREAISSTEVNEKLQEIVNKYKLQLDEGEELTKEIGYVMLGLKSPDSFVKNIQRATELNRETAEKVAEDVNNIIFKDIKDSLREITQKQATDEEDDFDEIEQARVRDELLQEIEKPNGATTDLIKQPEQDLQVISQPRDNKQTPQNTPPSNSPVSTKKDEQTLPKKDTIDPYREPIE